jgi:pimeloyl-ACP methyl ester carboxylesterase
MSTDQINECAHINCTDFSDKYLKTEYGTIHYSAQPKKHEESTIIFIHGAFVDCETMRPLACHFTDYQCVLVDLPAHGKSTGAPQQKVEGYANAMELFIHKLLEKGEIHKDIILVGWSMGGSISMLLALAGTLALRKVVPLSSSPMWIFPKIPKDQFNLYEIFSGAFTQSTPPEVKKRILDNVSLYSSSLDTCMVDIDALNRFDIRSKIANIKFPTEIVSGDADTIATVEMQHLMADTIKHAKLKLYFDRGHLLLLELPENVAEHIKESLKQLAGVS